MPERDRYIPGVPCWVDTSQPDPDAAAGFYSGLFGWEFEDAMPSDSPGRYLIAQLRGKTVAAVGSQPEGTDPAATWNTYVSVASADETAAKARDAGVPRRRRVRPLRLRADRSDGLAAQLRDQVPAGRASGMASRLPLPIRTGRSRSRRPRPDRAGSCQPSRALRGCIGLAHPRLVGLPDDTRANRGRVLVLDWTDWTSRTGERHSPGAAPRRLAGSQRSSLPMPEQDGDVPPPSGLPRAVWEPLRRL